MNAYHRQPLGLDVSIDQENVTPAIAASAGAMEGVADASRIAVVGLLVIGAYLIIPEDVLRSMTRRAKAILR